MNRFARFSTILLSLAGLVVAGLTLGAEPPPPEGFGGNTVTQIGIVVEDVEESAAAYADLFGVDVPRIIVTDPVEQAHTQFHGKPTEGRARLAFFNLGSLQLELIEPVGGPSTWREELEAHGEGVHHIAFKVDGMDEHIALLERRGGKLIQRGDFTGGSYAYVDATDELAVILELLTTDG